MVKRCMLTPKLESESFTQSVWFYVVACLGLALGWWAIGWLKIVAVVGGCFLTAMLLQLVLSVTSDSKWTEERIVDLWWLFWFIAAMVGVAGAMYRILATLGVHIGNW
jgi:hypothetical protein